MIPGTPAVSSFTPRPNPGVFALGIVALGIATGASGMLAYEHLSGHSLPGCGPGSACAQLAASRWGKIPGLEWPTSFAGAAYFAAMLAAWIGSRGIIPGWLRLVATLGALGSAAFMGIMLGMGHSGADTICPYCLTAHLANFGFLGLLALSPRPEFGIERPLRAPAAAIAALVLVTGGLAIADTKADQKARAGFKEEADQSVAEMLRRGKSTTQSASPSVVTPKIQQVSAAPVTEAAQPATPLQAAKPVKPPPAPPPAQVQGLNPAPPMPPQNLPAPGVFTGRYRFGPEKAPVRVVMYTDYQCPDCKLMEQQVEQILAAHPNEVSVSIKHFPFCTECNAQIAEANFHPNACWAARAAESAGILFGTEGFHKMHNWLFSKGGVFLNAEEITGAVRQAGFDPDQSRFLEMMTSDEPLKRIRTDIDEAVMYGLKNTPFVFVNGVELKGWKSPNSLVDAVNTLLAAHLEAMGPEVDHPVKARDSYVDEWRHNPAMAWPDRAKPWTQVPLRPAPKVRVTMWGDLMEPNCAEADKIIRNTVMGDPEVAYEFRYVPFDQECNKALPRQIIANGCKAAKAAEAAGQLGGTEAYWQMHAWITEHQKEFSDETVKAEAVKIGLKPDDFVAKMNSPEVEKIIQSDIELSSRVGVQEIPRIHVNGRWVPRWKLPGGFVLERIIDEAHKPPAPPPINVNPQIPQIPGVNAPIGSGPPVFNPPH
jgi:protein-disulfide isomerase/uncharacterized membrane protein